jgi:hypothetical protein
MDVTHPRFQKQRKGFRADQMGREEVGGRGSIAALSGSARAVFLTDVTLWWSAGGWYRDGCDGAGGDLQRLLWRSLLDVAPHEVCSHAGREDGAARHLRLARQHRVRHPFANLIQMPSSARPPFSTKRCPLSLVPHDSYCSTSALGCKRLSSAWRW